VLLKISLPNSVEAHAFAPIDTIVSGNTTLLRRQCRCVYEMHFAVCQGVPVKLCAHISPEDLWHGRVHEDTCVASAELSVDSSAALCGKPGEPQGSDEIMIRKVIDNSLNGFNGANVSVENIRLSYLAKYPMNDVTNYDVGSQESLKARMK